MINGCTVLAIIPARGGSKRVPGKNIRMVGGRPLLAWSVEAAKGSSIVDQVILSSDNAEIIKVAHSCGCDVPFVRPAELATDDAASVDVVCHALRNVGQEYDYVILLQPTSPLRLSSDIDGAIKRCAESGATTCVGLTPVNHSPYWMFRVEKSGIIKQMFPNVSVSHQSNPSAEILMLNGAIFVCRAKHLLEGGKFVEPDTIAWIMPRERSIDIDTEFDLIMADVMLKERKYHAVSAAR